MVSGRLVVGSGDDGAGARVHHEVEDEEGADDLVAPEAVVVHAPHEIAPVAGGLGHLAGRCHGAGGW